MAAKRRFALPDRCFAIDVVLPGTGFAAVAALVFGMGVYGLIGRATFAEVAPVPAEAWAVGRIGNALLEHYNLVFETLSVVLLLAIIGAILIARPGQRGKAA